MKKTATVLATLTMVVLLTGMPVAARETGASSAEARIEPSQSVAVVKATGVIRRSTSIYPYVSYRIFDTRDRRLYALVSFGSPYLLERHVGERVTVYGTRVYGYPRGSGPPALDVFRVVPTGKASA